MSKRNFILLIIALVVVLVLFLGFLYFRPTSTTPGVETGGTNFLSRFNPFGVKNNSNNGGEQPAVVEPGEIITTPAGEISKLMKVSSIPIAGYTVFSKDRFKEIPVENITVPSTDPNTPTELKPISTTPPEKETVSALRYVARADGNIYETYIDKINEKKFSNTVIPKVYDAYFGNNGDSVVMRYLKTNGETITTFLGNLPKEILGEEPKGDQEIKGAFLPDNIRDISISPDKKSMFYLFENETATDTNIVGTVLNFIDNSKTQIFDSPFTEWLSSWGSNSLITLSTKPAGIVPGYTYGIDPSKKILNKIFGPINGLTSLVSPDGKNIIFSDSFLNLSVYNTESRSSTSLVVRTLPEKCTFTKTGNMAFCAVPKNITPVIYPDSWYQGETSFSDQIWKIDLATNTTSLINDTTSINGGDLDAIKLSLDETEDHLFFVNKKDSFLWKLDLK